MDRRSFVTALGLAPFAASPLLANSGATGPKGKAYVADVKGVKIEEAGDGENGFARFRITL